MKRVFQQVSVMGLGLMGGSLALALRRAGAADRIVGYARREETRQQALEGGYCDTVSDDPLAAVRGSEMVIYCTPVNVVPKLAAAGIGGFSSGAVVTDVCSTKEWLVRELAALFNESDAVYLGSHPVTGSEMHGLEAARDDLYAGAVSVLTPLEDTPQIAKDSVHSLWRAIGMRTVEMSPGEHDRLLARSSHLPHMAAAALAAAVGRDDQSRVAEVIGSGFVDTTRIADGLPAMWREIVETNAENILRELKVFEAELRELSAAIERKDFSGVETFLETARRSRRALLKSFAQMSR